jgi:hypothetical protein
MNFNGVLTQTIAMLRAHGRVSYRALQRQFGLDDDFLADLKDELVVFQTWIWMETMPCISKPSRSSSPLLKHYPKMRHSSHFERKSPCVS